MPFECVTILQHAYEECGLDGDTSLGEVLCTEVHHAALNDTDMKYSDNTKMSSTASLYNNMFILELFM